MLEPVLYRTESASSSHSLLQFDSDGIPHFECPYQSIRNEKGSNSDGNNMRNIAEAEKIIREAEEDHERSTLSSQRNHNNNTTNSRIESDIQDRPTLKLMIATSKKQLAPLVTTGHKKRRSTVTAIHYTLSKDLATPTMTSAPI